MRAMILAAGFGKRMQPLTLNSPKALLPVNGKPLIVYHLERLAKANVHEIVINLGHLAEKIEQALGDGSQFGVSIQYSYENPVLETGGGIAKALKYLGPEPFIALSCDIFSDYPLSRLPKDPTGLAHLVFTDNPPYNPKGDFALRGDEVFATGDPLLNFGGIAVYRPELFTDCPVGAFPLSILFKKAIEHRKMTGEYYSGIWYNIGTPVQLEQINQLMQSGVLENF